MSVLPGEGTHVILYGPASLSARTQIHDCYIARPDLAGSYPAIVLIHGVDGITAGIKALARSLARHGFAVIALDLYRGRGPERGADESEHLAAYAALGDARALADLNDVYRFNRRTEWADHDRMALLGIGTGGRFALLSAVDQPSVLALAIVYTPLTSDRDREPQAAEVLADLTVPLLGLYGRDDEVVEASEPEGAHQGSQGGEWVIYVGGRHGFLDDSAAGYDEGIAADATERLVAFFAKSLGPVAVAGEA